jgi:hypothetical protein
MNMDKTQKFTIERKMCICPVCGSNHVKKKDLKKGESIEKK